MKRFIHIPKTAGRSMIKFLRENKLQVNSPRTKDNGAQTKKHRTAYKYYKDFPNEERFWIVRNPYSRLVSFYNFAIRMGWLEKDYPWVQFVMDRPYIAPLRNNQPWRLQIDYIMNNNKFYVHKKFKLETELERLQAYLHTPKPFPKVNVSKQTGVSLPSYYTNSTVLERVRKDFKKDFKHLHYTRMI